VRALIARVRKRSPWYDAVGYTLVVVWAIITLFPLYWMVMTALEPPTEVIKIPPQLLPTQPSAVNFERILNLSPLPRWFLNSAVVAGSRTLTALFFASLAGYSFAKLRFMGREFLFWMILTVVMIPGFVTIIPLYQVVLALKWINTYWALVVPGFTGGAYAIFLMRQFMKTLPNELGECARIDGAGEFRVFWQVYLPLCKPGLAVLGIFTFVGHWNDFLWPLLVTNQHLMRTLAVGLQTLKAERSTDYGLLMAGGTYAAVPMVIVFLVFQRYFLQGITIGAIKG
jgi:multiple sugar transport system permease protein